MTSEDFRNEERITNLTPVVTAETTTLTLCNHSNAVELSNRDHLWNSVILIVLLLVLMLAGSLGNFVVVSTYVIKRHKSTANYLMLVLGIIDLFSCGLIHPYVIYKHVTYFTLPVHVCKLFEYLTHYMLALHLGVMTTIAVDRYCVVCRQSRFAHTFNRIVKMTLTTIFGGIFLCSPLLVFFGHKTVTIVMGDCLYELQVCDVSDEATGSTLLRLFVWASFASMLVSVAFIGVMFALIRRTVRRRKRTVAAGVLIVRQPASAAARDVNAGNAANGNNVQLAMKTGGILRSSNESLQPKCQTDKGTVYLPSSTNGLSSPSARKTDIAMNGNNLSICIESSNVSELSSAAASSASRHADAPKLSFLQQNHELAVNQQQLTFTSRRRASDSNIQVRKSRGVSKMMRTPLTARKSLLATFGFSAGALSSPVRTLSRSMPDHSSLNCVALSASLRSSSSEYFDKPFKKTVTFDEQDYIQQVTDVIQSVPRERETPARHHDARVHFAKLFYYVIVAFLISWLPYWVINIMEIVYPPSSRLRLVESGIVNIFYSIFYVSNVIKPIVYVTQSQLFRKDVASAVRLCKDGRIVCFARAALRRQRKSNAQNVSRVELNS